MSSQHPLEARLKEAAARFPYPPTPPLAQTLRQRRRALDNPPRPPLRWRPALFIAVCALLVLWPLATPLRAAVERLLRIGAVEIVVATPIPATVTPPFSTPSPLLAGETTLAEAQTRVPFTIRLPSYPADLGAPDQVFVQGTDSTSLIMLWLEPATNQPRLGLQVLDGDIIAQKFLLADEQAQRTTVDGGPAVWIDVPHVLEYTIPDGQRTLREGRFVEGTVLVWIADGATYRLESGLPLEEARRVAESLR